MKSPPLSLAGLRVVRVGLRLHDPEQRVPLPQARDQALREEPQTDGHRKPSVQVRL